MNHRETETQLLMDWMMRVQPILTLMLRSGYHGFTTPAYGNLSTLENSSSSDFFNHNITYSRIFTCRKCYAYYANSNSCKKWICCVVVNLTKSEKSVIDNISNKFSSFLSSLKEPGTKCKGKLK